MLHLKVYSGPQLDATIELEPNVNYSIANSYVADIYLEGSLIDEPGVFRLDSSSIIFSYIKPNSLKLRNQENVISNVYYQLPVFFQSGIVKFAISDKDIQNWDEEASFATENSSLEESLVNIVPSDKEATDDFINTIDGVLQDNDTAGTVIAPEEIINNKNEDIENKPKILISRLKSKVLDEFIKIRKFIVSFIRYAHKNYRMQFYASISIILILLVITIISVRYVKKENLITTLNQDSLQQSRDIRKVFSELPNKYANLSLRQNNNYFLLTGLVYNNNDLLELKTYFKHYLTSIKIQVLTVDQAVLIIKNIANTYNISPFTVDYDKLNQELVISGITTGDSTKINDFQIEVSNQLSGVPNLKFAIYNKDQILQELNDKLQLQSKYLELHESASVVRPQLLISGYLTTKQLSSFNESVEALRLKYKSVLDINLNIKNSLSALPFKIYSVYTGSPAYITTLSGDVVYIGGEIGGFKLVSITDKKIIFNGKMPLEIPLTQINDGDIESDDSINKSAATRKQVLNDEFNRVKNAIAEEEKQISYLQEYHNKISDPEIGKFIESQISNLNDDIKSKQKDINYYTKAINPE